MHINKIILFLQNKTFEKKTVKEINEFLIKNGIKTSLSKTRRLIDEAIKIDLFNLTIDRNKHPKRFPTKFYSNKKKDESTIL